MDFNSARNRLNQAVQDWRDNLEKTVRADWDRSKEEATLLWIEANRAARGLKKISEEVAAEVTTEVKVAKEQIQAHLASEEFESQLDELLRRSKLEARYEAVHKRRQRQKSGTDFASVNASVDNDPLDKADAYETETEEVAARKERIREKLAFLYKHYGEDVLEAAKAGAFLGSILGPRTALRFAIIAGGLKMAVLLGGASYTVFVKPTGDWSID